jgi:hypothetical protein
MWTYLRVSKEETIKTLVCGTFQKFSIIHMLALTCSPFSEQVRV